MPLAFPPPAPHRPSALRRAAAGFSLIELVLVLAIGGVLLGFAAPRIDLPHFAIDATMRNVGTALILAQQEAVARQHDVIVTFDSAGARVLVHWDEDGNRLRGTDERVRIIPLEGGIAFGRPTAVPARGFGTGAVARTPLAGFPAVTFRRTGSASEGGGFYLTTQRALRSPAYHKDTRALEWERATGRMEWFRYSSGSVWRRGF